MILNASTSMRAEEWQETLEKIAQRFPILERSREALPREEGGGFKEIIIFQTPKDKFRLEFSERPKVIGQKIHAHRRKSDALVEKLFSSEEKVTSLGAFRWKAETMEWQEVKAENLESNS